jgi:hypothetical protein
MSGQEQLKRNKTIGGCDCDSGNADLRAQIPKVARLFHKIEEMQKKEPCRRGGGCKWSSICTFDCEEKI